jgi:hypothetical protein
MVDDARDRRRCLTLASMFPAPLTLATGSRAETPPRRRQELGNGDNGHASLGYRGHSGADKRFFKVHTVDIFDVLLLGRTSLAFFT